MHPDRGGRGVEGTGSKIKCAICAMQSVAVVTKYFEDPKGTNVHRMNQTFSVYNVDVK